jgi:hypothetical protein
VKINHTAQIEIKHDTTFGQILHAVTTAEVPDEAKVSVEKYAGDPRDPGYTRLTFEWTTGDAR